MNSFESFTNNSDDSIFVGPIAEPTPLVEQVGPVDEQPAQPEEIQPVGETAERVADRERGNKAILAEKVRATINNVKKSRLSKSLPCSP